jgi:hypothetical protein
MISLNGNLNIKVEQTKTTFSSLINGSWQIAGIETNTVYNGTKSLTRNTSIKSVSYSINNATLYTEVSRYNLYAGGAKITDIYSFYGNTTDPEMFPVAHRIIIENASGLIYQYQVTNLEYYGKTFLNASSPQSFGKNMKVEWKETPYYSRVYKGTTSTNSKLTLKYKITSDYKEYNIRLFDPVLANLTINLLNTSTYMGGTYNFDQVNIAGVLYVNSSQGYLNINANNITVTGSIIGTALGNQTGGTAGGGGGSPRGNGGGGGTGIGSGAGTAGGGAVATSTGGGGGTGASIVAGSLDGRYDFTLGGSGAGGGGGGTGADACCNYAQGGNGGVGANGGAVIRLNATNITVSGTLSATGGAGGGGGGGYNGGWSGTTSGGGGGGGGSGGQILLDGYTLKLDNSQLFVNGGSGGPGGSGRYGGNGGSGTNGVGGRIKIFYGNTVSTSGITMTLGTSGTNYTQFTNAIITQIAPAVNNYTLNNANDFNCTFNSTQAVPIYNIGLNFYDSNGVLYNYTYKNTSGFSNNTFFSYNWTNYNLPDAGKYNWTCSANVKPYDLNSTGGTNGTLTQYNYSVPMIQGLESSQRSLFIDNYNLIANFSSNLVNGTWYKVSYLTTGITVSGVPSYNATYIIKNSTATYLTNNTINNASFHYYYLPDGNWNSSVNVTSCPLCQYVPTIASAKYYNSYLNYYTFGIDTVIPVVNWDTSTTADTRTANFSLQNWVYAKAAVAELNIANITFTIRNSSGVYNITIISP